MYCQLISFLIYSAYIELINIKTALINAHGKQNAQKTQNKKSPIMLFPAKGLRHPAVKLECMLLPRL